MSSASPNQIASEAQRPRRGGAPAVAPSAETAGAGLSAFCVIGEDASVAVSAVLGNHVHVERGASVGAASVLRAHCSLREGASVGAATHIGDGTTLGPAATVGDHATLGPHSRVGAAAQVATRVAVGAGATVGARAHIAERVHCGAHLHVGADAIVAEGAILGAGVSVGVNARVGKQATIGDGTSLAVEVRVGDGAALGAGCVAAARAVLAVGATVADSVHLGSRSHLHQKASVGVNTTVAAGASIGASAAIGADCRIGADTTVGRGAVLADSAVLHDNVTLGEGTMVGVGAVIGRAAVTGPGVHIPAGAVVAPGADVHMSLPPPPPQGAPFRVSIYDDALPQRPADGAWVWRSGTLPASDTLAEALAAGQTMLGGGADVTAGDLPPTGVACYEDFNAQKTHPATFEPFGQVRWRATTLRSDVGGFTAAVVREGGVIPRLVIAHASSEEHAVLSIMVDVKAVLTGAVGEAAARTGSAPAPWAARGREEKDALLSALSREDWAYEPARFDLFDAWLSDDMSPSLFAWEGDMRHLARGAVSRIYRTHGGAIEVQSDLWAAVEDGSLLATDLAATQGVDID